MPNVPHQTHSSATENVPPSSPPRIVVFGIRCAFTNAIVRGLIAIGHSPVALLFPGPPKTIGLQLLSSPRRLVPLVSSQTQPTQSFEGIPTFNIGGIRRKVTAAQVAEFAPDILIVACFPHLIPASIRSTASVAALNIHPSLLPRHRGPDPLFWTLRDGSGQAGVTIHELADTLDTGPVLGQTAIRYADGTSEEQLESMLATVATDLLRSVITSIETSTRLARSQDESAATYETWPTASDYSIDTRRTARSAYNFIRGIAHRGVPVTIMIGDQTVLTTEAVAYGNTEGQVNWPADGQVAIPFEDGVLVVRPVDHS